MNREFLSPLDSEQQFAKLNVVLVGLPGSGKSSLMDSLRVKPNYLSLGEISRAEMAKPMSHMAEVQRRLFETTAPWPADLVVNMVAPYLLASQNGFVLDGVPRKASEARALVDWSKEQGVPIDLLLHLDISPDTAMQRIMGRDNKGRMETQAHYESRMTAYLAEESEMLDIMRREAINSLTIDTNDNPAGRAKEILLEFVASKGL